jgi:cell division protein FtsL
MVKDLMKTTRKRRTPPSGPGVRQLHQRRLERTRVRGGRRQGPAPDRPLRLALLATAVLTVGTIFGAAIFHVLLIQSEFRLDLLHKEAAKEEARYEKLRLDVAQLSAPERIVATAQQRLGMVVPPQIAYLMAPAPQDGRASDTTSEDPAAPSLAGGWAEVKPHLGTRP